MAKTRTPSPWPSDASDSDVDFGKAVVLDEVTGQVAKHFGETEDECFGKLLHSGFEGMTEQDRNNIDTAWFINHQQRGSKN